MVPPTVTCDWLKKQIDSGHSTLCVLDASWSLLVDYHKEFIEKHIPTAVQYDANKPIKPTPFIPRNLPEPGDFTNYVRTLGVSATDHIVLYDRGGLPFGNMIAAARAWWVFRAMGHNDVSVLEGGLDGWESCGFQTESGLEKPQQIGTFEARKDESLMIYSQDVVNLVEMGGTQIVDTRLEEHFQGQEAEPSIWTITALRGMNQVVPATMHKGSIPGSINIPIPMICDTTTLSIVQREQLEKLFQSRGLDLAKPIAVSCYIGHSTCLFALALAVCGKMDTKVYFGSWTEWGQVADSKYCVLPQGT